MNKLKVKNPRETKGLLLHDEAYSMLRHFFNYKFKDIAKAENKAQEYMNRVNVIKKEHKEFVEREYIFLMMWVNEFF